MSWWRRRGVGPAFYGAFCGGFIHEAGLFSVFIADTDAAEAAGCVDIDSVFTFFVVPFSVVGRAAEDEAGFDFYLHVLGDFNIDATEQTKGFYHGVFGEFRVF